MEKLAFFCTIFKSEIIDDVGKLDELFGDGYSDDNDYCERIKKLHLKMVLVPSVYIGNKKEIK